MTALLADRAIAVTGASRGLGRAIAVACVDHGARVAIGYRVRRAEAEALAEELTTKGGRPCLAFAIDLGDSGSLAGAVGAAWDRLGGLDAWVNNAAVGPGGLLVTADPADLQRRLEIDLLGPMLCARAAIERMLRRRRGVLLNVSSVAAVRPVRGQAGYAAAKGGLEAFTRAIAVEYAKKGIRAVALRPGAIDTDLLAATCALGEEEMVARIPLRRVATPAEIAEHAVFLLSDRAAYTTGTVVTVDGGYSVG